jgi:hypothetical protein
MAVVFALAFVLLAFPKVTLKDRYPSDLHHCLNHT